MTPSEFVYRQIFDKAIQLGVSEESANTQALIGVNQYKIKMELPESTVWKVIKRSGYVN